MQRTPALAKTISLGGDAQFLRQGDQPSVGRANDL
jgi:hypothetical protein